jgi:formate dehydrogenase major subunit
MSERDRGIQNLVWDYERDPGHEDAIVGEPDAEKVLREINGYHTGDVTRHLTGPNDLKNDGSTTCASWIYCGVFPAPDQNHAARKEQDAPGTPGADAHLNWGWAWPMNRRVLYNRASADPAGRPWSERKKWVWWDGKQWTGYDTPDFPPAKAPTTPAKPGALGLDAHSGHQPFILKPDGVGWLFNPAGLLDGPLPSHYEPVESPVHNALYTRQTSPLVKYWKRDDNVIAPVADPKFPYVITTYRLTEHYLAGAMSRWNPWLSELMPELFVELSPELAADKGIRNTEWVRISTPRARIRARALVTRRMRPLKIDGRVVHQVGMPWHWGWEGLVTGDVVNELTAMVGEPNVSIHEGKAFVCNVERA